MVSPGAGDFGCRGVSEHRVSESRAASTPNGRDRPTDVLCPSAGSHTQVPRNKLIPSSG